MRGPPTPNHLEQYGINKNNNLKKEMEISINIDKERSGNYLPNLKVKIIEQKEQMI